MSKAFKYKAVTGDGQRLSGIIHADDELRVAGILGEQALIPIDIRPCGESIKPGIFGFLKSHNYEHLILFTRNLATLFRAGIPILRALSLIKIGEPNSYFNKAVKQIIGSVESGHSLADSLGDFPKIFPKVYTATITAGEQSGKLDEILDSLAIMLEKDLELNRQIKSSVRYPVAVIGAIAGAFIILITFVIPRFVQFFGKMGADLPLPTQILIGINQFITNFWYISLAIIIISVLLIRYLISKPEGKLAFDRMVLNLPVFGDLIIKGTTARFAYIFQILIKSGIPVVRALDMLKDIVKNQIIINEIKSMGESFRGGRELNRTAAEGKSYFPEMAIQMIKIGLESGSLDNMLAEVAGHYSKEVDYKSRHLTSLLEPILTIVLGLFVLLVALAIFLPMWNLIQLFRG